ncbi:MAG: hypothetical protein U0Z44_09615 [Kouleothrix sp.]
MVEHGRQLGLDRGAKQVGWRRGCGREHLSTSGWWISTPPGACGSATTIPSTDNTVSAWQAGQPSTSGIFDHDLGQALAVAQDQEAEVAELPQAMQPAGDAHALPDMRADPSRRDSFHGDTLCEF